MPPVNGTVSIWISASAVVVKSLVLLRITSRNPVQNGVPKLYRCEPAADRGHVWGRRLRPTRICRWLLCERRTFFNCDCGKCSKLWYVGENGYGEVCYQKWVEVGIKRWLVQKSYFFRFTKIIKIREFTYMNKNIVRIIKSMWIAGE